MDNSSIYAFKYFLLAVAIIILIWKLMVRSIK